MGHSCAPRGEAKVSGNTALVNAALIGMGLLCGFEMLLLICTTFRRRSGLYFWSLVISTIAQMINNISLVLYYFVLRDSCPGITAALSIPATFFFVFFEYFVLYSRLSLVQTSNKKLLILRGIIFTEVALLEIPVGVIYLCSIIYPTSVFPSLYQTIWQVEAVVYTVVDFAISMMYILQIKGMWSKESTPAVQSILRDIVGMTIVVIGIDAVNSALVFVGPVFPVIYALEGFMFAFKLKVEMWSLNRLTDISRTTLVTTNQDLTGSSLNKWPE